MTSRRPTPHPAIIVALLLLTLVVGLLSGTQPLVAAEWPLALAVQLYLLSLKAYAVTAPLRAPSVSAHILVGVNQVLQIGHLFLQGSSCLPVDRAYIPVLGRALSE